MNNTPGTEISLLITAEQQHTFEVMIHRAVCMVCVLNNCWLSKALSTVPVTWDPCTESPVSCHGRNHEQETKQRHRQRSGMTGSSRQGKETIDSENLCIYLLHLSQGQRVFPETVMVTIVG